MAATAGNAGWRTVIATRNARRTVEKIIWRYERSGVAKPAARDANPWGTGICAITNAPAHGAAIITLKKAKACSCAYWIDARVETITSYA